MLRIVGERRIRVIDDRGEMEIFRPTFGRDNEAFLRGGMVGTLGEELGVDFEGGDTTAHRREDLGKGAEPDQCDWFGEKAGPAGCAAGASST